MGAIFAYLRGMEVKKCLAYVKLLGARVISPLRFAPLLVYISAVATVVAQLMILEYWIAEVNPWMDVELLQVLADAMVVMMPFVWLRRRWRLLVWVPIAGFTIFCYVNLWYARAFYDLMPLESVGMAGNMEGPVIDAFFDMVHAMDWLLLLPVAAFGLVTWLLRARWLKGEFHLLVKIWLPVASLLMWVLAYSVRVYYYRLNDCAGLPYTKVWTDYYELSKTKSYKFTQHLHRMGYVGYGIWQINNIFNSRSITDEESAEIEEYWAKQRLTNGDHDGTYAHNRGRNLIFIIIESLASDAVGMEVNGVQVTPNISRLIADDSTAVVMRHVVAQVNHGRSSDGQFIYNTGLLPLRNNVVAKRFPAANYPSIAKALGYPAAFEVIGERYTFYNHSTTNLSYGYHKLIAAPTSQMIPDEEVLANFLGEIKNAKTPFYAEMTTLQTHDPYLGGADSPSAIVADLSHDIRDLNYLDRVREFDERLGVFIDQLKESGIYDNSVIVLAADHEPRKSCLSEDGFISSDIFFAALNTGAKGVEINRTVGQVDVFPTILKIMGISDYRYPGLGVSPLTDADHHGAQDAFGEVYGGPDAATLRRIEQAWRLSEIMIEGRYFN